MLAEAVAVVVATAGWSAPVVATSDPGLDGPVALTAGTGVVVVVGRRREAASRSSDHRAGRAALATGGRSRRWSAVAGVSGADAPGPASTPDGPASSRGAASRPPSTARTTISTDVAISCPRWPISPMDMTRSPNCDADG